jgi:hypothetical protein
MGTGAQNGESKARKKGESKVSVRQAIREIDMALKENKGRLMPNSKLFHSIINALKDLDQRVIALEQASPPTTFQMKDLTPSAGTTQPRINDG